MHISVTVDFLKWNDKSLRHPRKWMSGTEAAAASPFPQHHPYRHFNVILKLSKKHNFLFCIKEQNKIKLHSKVENFHRIYFQKLSSAFYEKTFRYIVYCDLYTSSISKPEMFQSIVSYELIVRNVRHPPSHSLTE